MRRVKRSPSSAAVGTVAACAPPGDPPAIDLHVETGAMDRGGVRRLCHAPLCGALLARGASRFPAFRFRLGRGILRQHHALACRGNHRTHPAQAGISPALVEYRTAATRLSGGLHGPLVAPREACRARRNQRSPGSRDNRRHHRPRGENDLAHELVHLACLVAKRARCNVRLLHIIEVPRRLPLTATPTAATELADRIIIQALAEASETGCAARAQPSCSPRTMKTCWWSWPTKSGGSTKDG